MRSKDYIGALVLSHCLTAPCSARGLSATVSAMASSRALRVAAALFYPTTLLRSCRMAGTPRGRRFPGDDRQRSVPDEGRSAPGRILLSLEAGCAEGRAHHSCQGKRNFRLFRTQLKPWRITHVKQGRPPLPVGCGAVNPGGARSRSTVSGWVLRGRGRSTTGSFTSPPRISRLCIQGRF
jgi:hypothetical protein